MMAMERRGERRTDYKCGEQGIMDELAGCTSASGIETSPDFIERHCGLEVGTQQLDLRALIAMRREKG